MLAVMFRIVSLYVENNVENRFTIMLAVMLRIVSLYVGSNV